MPLFFAYKALHRHGAILLSPSGNFVKPLRPLLRLISILSLSAHDYIFIFSYILEHLVIQRGITALRSAGLPLWYVDFWLSLIYRISFAMLSLHTVIISSEQRSQNFKASKMILQCQNISLHGIHLFSLHCLIYWKRADYIAFHFSFFHICRYFRHIAK